MLNKKEFGKIRKEIEAFDAKRESIIQTSREVINLSKRIIYAVHRNDLKSASIYVKDIEKKKKSLDAHIWIDANISQTALQEYVEALCYYHFVKDNKIRLSIEGSQLIGPKAKKNIVELNDKEAKEWLKGIDLDKKTNNNGFVLIKHKNDFIGCGKQMKDKILNYVPKIRRLNVSD